MICKTSEALLRKKYITAFHENNLYDQSFASNHLSTLCLWNLDMILKGQSFSFSDRKKIADNQRLDSWKEATSHQSNSSLLIFSTN